MSWDFRNAGVAVNAPIVTSLPSTANDGQEVVFTDSLSAPAYSWRLKYFAAKSSNKWAFVGGTSIKIPYSDANIAIGSLTSTGQSFVSQTERYHASQQVNVPVTGIYRIHGMVFVIANSGQTGVVFAGAQYAGNNHLQNQQSAAHLTGTGVYLGVPFMGESPSLAAGTSFGPLVASTNAAQILLRWATGDIWPVFLGG